MKCNYCGLTFPEGFHGTFCPQCGHLIDGKEQKETRASTGTDPVTPSTGADPVTPNTGTSSGPYTPVNDSFGDPYWTCGAPFQSVPTQPMPGYSGVDAGIPDPSDKKSVGFNILSFFFPIVGLIIYLVQKDKKPKRAKSAGKSAIAGFVIGFVLSLVGMILAAFSAANSLAGLRDMSGSGDYEYSVHAEYNGEEWTYSYGGKEDETARAEETTERTTYQPAAGVSSDFTWGKMTYSVDGKAVTLPCSYTDFVKATGYSLDLSLDSLEHDQYYIGATCIDSSGRELEIVLFNPDKEEKPAKECMIIGIGVNSSFMDNCADVVFPGNISVGDPIDKDALLDIFEEPGNKYDGDDGYFVWTWYGNKGYQSDAKITSSDGKTITAVKIDDFTNWE